MGTHTNNEKNNSGIFVLFIYKILSLQWYINGVIK